MTEPLNKLSALINDRLEQKGLKAKEVAQLVGINETTFSAIRAGKRKVSKDLAMALAKTLGTKTKEEDQGEFLVAAGYAPQSGPKRKPIVVQLYTLEALLDIESSMQSGQEVWVFSRGIIETFSESFFTVVRDNLRRKVSYTYFIHHSNALDYVKLLQKLHQDSISLSRDLLRCCVLPDESFLYKDLNLFECIYNARDDKSFRVFRTSREVEGEYLYREVHRHEAIDIRDYLTEMLTEATNRGGDIQPCLVESYLRKTYNLDLAKLTKSRTSRKT